MSADTASDWWGWTFGLPFFPEVYIVDNIFFKLDALALRADCPLLPVVLAFT